MNCQVPHCPVVAWKHGLCKDHWIANARNEPTGLPTPGLPAWAHPAPALAKDAVSATATAPPPPKAPRVTRQPAPPKGPLARCSVPGCDRRAAAKGKCDRHYRQDWEAKRRTAAATMPATALPRPAAAREGVDPTRTMPPLETTVLRLVWSCVPEHGAQLHEVADACGLGLGATVTALHALETTYGYVTFDGAYWHALIPCGRQRGATP